MSRETDSRLRRRVVPNHWQGETGCLVGPFRSREVASSFMQFVLTESNVVSGPDCLVEFGGNWFVRVPEGAALERDTGGFDVAVNS